jgi:hypothetical protein
VDWNGRRSRLGKVQGVAGSGEFKVRGKAQTTFGRVNHPIRGSREDSAAAQPTTGVSGDVSAYFA